MNVFPSKSNLYFTIIFFLNLSLILTGCNKELDISNFDEAAWKADKMACRHKRGELENNLLEAKSELIELTQQDIISLLGRPEMQELYTRGQKFFIYYLTPSSKCDEVSEFDGKPKLLYIRFSALNQVTEVFVK
jgi:hypothetical protein